MECQVTELLIRINRLSEIALEFHGEPLGDAATDAALDTALELIEVEEQ